MSAATRGLDGFADIPVNRFFDWRILPRSNGQAEIVLPLKPDYVQGEGVVHGGIITAVADTAAVYALLPSLPAEKAMTSIDLKVNFLRSVLPDGGELVARSRVVQRGRRIALCDVEVFQDAKLAAKGLFTYLIFDRE